MAVRIAVVGAGYAGLASAVELADAGCTVEVFEASRTLGGRARAIELDGMTVDNGAHILVGAYRETLRLMEKVGAGGTALKRQSLHLEYPGQVRIAAPKLPAPLHLGWALLTAQGLTFKEKLAALRFMRAQQQRGFRLPEDLSAADLLAAHCQPERVRRFLWEPLCLAALNTPVASASAQVFLNVLRDSLAADGAASDLLLPATDFSALFPEPAACFIEARSGKVHRSARIGTLEELKDFDHIVIAVAPYHLAALAPDIAERYPFDWQPIATCYLAYPGATLLPFPMIGLDGGHAQWVFDRGALCGQQGLIAAVISGTGPWQALGHDELAMSIHEQIAALLPDLRPPHKTWVIEEKRATFSCTPGLVRPPTATTLPNVWLAGDYVAGDYPATLEGAVRSGVVAAREILRRSPSTGPAPARH
jgi:squalene-associated FAD-dependent desaturase